MNIAERILGKLHYFASEKFITVENLASIARAINKEIKDEEKDLISKIHSQPLQFEPDYKSLYFKQVDLISKLLFDNNLDKEDIHNLHNLRRQSELLEKRIADLKDEVLDLTYELARLKYRNRNLQ